jgi:ETC complex I subunit-like protein
MQTLHTNTTPGPVGREFSAAGLANCASVMEQSGTQAMQGKRIVPSTPAVTIFQDAASVMQAGRASRRWILRFEPRSAPFIEPLMGWTGTADTLQQVKLIFPTKEHAISFAQRHGWRYSVKEPSSSTLRPKSYLDNFRYREPAPAATGGCGIGL